MKIIVCLKRVVDTETRVKVLPDGRTLDLSGVAWITAPYDEMALARAVDLREETGGGTVTVVTLGPAEAGKELRTALAIGADDALHLLGDPTADAWATAQALAGALEGRPFDLLLCGKQATDADDAAVGPMLAALLGLPCVTFVDRIEPTGGGLRVRRERDGEAEILEVPLPCVLTAQKGLAEARLPGLKGIMASKKKPLETREVEVSASLTEILALALPPPRAGLVRVEPTAEGLRGLLETLRHERKVL